MGKAPRGRAAALAAIVAALATIALASASSKVVLPNGWSITPAGTLVKLGGDMPLRIVPAPDGHSMLVVTGGFHDHAIDVIDPDSGTARQHLLLGKAWAGLAADQGGSTVYVSGGGAWEAKDLAKLPEKANLAPAVTDSLSKPVLRLDWSNGALTAQTGLAIAGLADDDRFIAGLALDREKHLLVLNIQTDTLYKLDSVSGQVLASAKLGYRPFQMALSADGAHVAITNWGDKSVSLLDTANLRERTRVPVGIHPTDLAFGPDGRLFVANAGSNSVSVIKDDHVVETIMTSLHAGDPVGTTPNAVAVAPDGSRLYVADADNNDIAVIDIHDASSSRVVGFIPTGWYPSTLALTPDGKNLVVGIAKGVGSRGNSPAQIPVSRTSSVWHSYSTAPFDYVGDIMTGYAEIIAVPNEKALADYSRQVAANSPVGEARIKPAEKREAETAFRQIKHVIYVIRENRTYDQVLGDDPRGDGKPDLVFFGATVTPNAHRLVHDTVLLDHYFVNGEVSEDGHNWANQAYATAFNERTTASTYGGRGEPFGDERLEYSPAGHLWDAAKRAGLSYFSYGEGADFTSSQTAPPTFSGTLKDHASPDWGEFITKTDVDRAKVLVRDIKAHEEKGDLPAYTVVWLPWDHTLGMTPKAPTPQATVAINDLALGMLVEAVSHSKFWRSTAIFVTEDDAQAGPDHVDDHRSVALVISPYVKQGLVDHTHYTMTSLIRTMELILRLPPMTQYDRDATPLYRVFQSRPRDWTYSVQQETVDLHAINPASGSLQKASLDLDFSAPDRADPQKLNAILWAALKPGVPMPAPVRGRH
jgi:YVTN family beta-propeller protein